MAEKQRGSGKMPSDIRHRVSCSIFFADDGKQYAHALAGDLLRSGIYPRPISLRTPSKILSDYIFLRRNTALILVCTSRAFHSDAFHFLLGTLSRRPRFIPTLLIAFKGSSLKEIHTLIGQIAVGGIYQEDLPRLKSGPTLSTLRFLRDILTRLTEERTFSVQFELPLSLTPKKKLKRALNEGKLILVGRGEVGKTSLLNRLVHNKFRGDEAKTQGINITSWSVRSRSGRVRLNIWDFGGQEIMHATHQFFLTERSLYLLVLNGREGGVDEDTEYWLKHIETFGGDSPVIVIQNKIKQHAFELNYRGLRARYPQIRAFVKTDCKEPIGIKELRTEIQKAIGKMPEVRMRFPSHWFKIKTHLEKMKDSFIEYEVFKTLCDESGLKREPDRDTLSWVLHCLGIALTYRDDWRLRETSVLKPEWITDGIYRILNAPILANRQGELNLGDLSNILPKKIYPSEKHRFLIELMRKFSLCFAFPDAEDRYLIPELLGKEEPAEAQQFQPGECLNFEYHYAVLPEGLIPRFIVRSHTLSHGQNRWKSGVVLVHEDCRALVKSQPGDRRVIIRVKGGNPGSRQRLLAIIRYDVDHIHAEFKDRLEVYPKVPLPQYPEVTVDYNKLIAFEKQGVQEFPEVLGAKVITVYVSELLNGVDLEAQRTESLEQIIKAKSVFFSYSHKDEGLRDELETHLKLLQRQNVISTWHDRKILPSTEWDREIDSHLESANIILLLVSADFVASDYCWEKEVKRAMERHEAGEATVIPIILRMCDWERAPFGKLQGLPTNVKPITNWEDRDAAWTDVVKGIRKTAETTATPTKLMTASS